MSINIGDIINGKWKLIAISRKKMYSNNVTRKVYRVQCMDCGTIDENESQIILRRTKCKGCKIKELQSLIGKRQKNMVILSIHDELDENRNIIADCQCDCGNIFTATMSSINRGLGSCGCLKGISNISNIKVYGNRTVKELSEYYGTTEYNIYNLYRNNNLKQYMIDRQNEFMKEFYRQFQINK